MKKLYALFFIFFTCNLMYAQTTVTLTLNANDEDASIDNYNPGNNYPNEIEYASRAWTISGTPVTWRSLFKFNLQCIPSNAVVTSAFLSLYYADTNNYGNAQHSSLTSSNESVLERVTSSWSANTVTWNSQPTSTTADEVILPQSISGTQDYLNMNVTPMVQQMISNGNNGFLLRLTNEMYYAQMFFASGNNPHLNKHPALTITYTLPSVICLDLTLNGSDEDATIDNYNPGNNYPNEIEYASRAWTISGTPVTWRSLFKFNLQCIPSNAVVSSASLSLYYADVNNFGNAQHSSLTSSDESVLKRVTSSWSENTITWNNQPSTTATDEVILPQSLSGTQDYLSMDVTPMVQQMISGNNNGFLLRLTNETYYAQMFFASGDNPHSNKHPQLQVCYSLAATVNDISDAGDLTVFPNPTEGKITVNSTKVKIQNVEVHTMLGELLDVYSNDHRQNTIQIDISDFSKGIYFLNIKTQDGIVVKKIVKE
jgi:hypothetical protein